MLLKLTTTHQPATDLGYLLAKNPARVQSAELSFGQAQICYPEASAERCNDELESVVMHGSWRTRCHPRMNLGLERRRGGARCMRAGGALRRAQRTTWSCAALVALDPPRPAVYFLRMNINLTGHRGSAARP